MSCDVAVSPAAPAAVPRGGAPRRKLGVAVAVLLAFLAGCSGSRDNAANRPAELQAFDRQVTLRSRWQVAVGNGQGRIYNELRPAIAGGRVFAAAANGTVLAVAREDGRVVWRQRLRDEISGGVGTGAGLVLLGTRDGELIALAQGDGTVRWRRQLSSEILAPPRTNGVIVVTQTSDDKVTALAADTGEPLWIYEAALPPLTLRGTSSPLIVGDQVLAGFSNGTMVAVDANTGIVNWEERVAVPTGQYDIDRVIDVDGELARNGNRLYVSSYQGNLVALDIASGRIVWGHEASSYHGLAFGFGNVYYSDDRSRITALRDNSSDVAWLNEDLLNRSLTAPIVLANYVAVADFEGYVHLLSQIDGQVIGRARVDNDGIRADLLVADGTLYAYGNSGRLVALELR